MKKTALPIAILIAGLIVAQVFFGVDVKSLTAGFLGFLADILRGNSQ